MWYVCILHSEFILEKESSYNLHFQIDHIFFFQISITNMINWTSRLQDDIVTSNNHLNNIIHNKASTITNLKITMDLNSINSSLLNELRYNNEYKGTIQNR